MKKLCNELITKDTVNNLLDELKQERELDMELFWMYQGGNRQNWNSLITGFKNFTNKRSKWMLDNLNRNI